MPFAGGGAFQGNSHAASANTNRAYSLSSDGLGFVQTQLINTDGLCGMSIQVDQQAGVAGTGGIRLVIEPYGDGVPYPTPTTAIAALNAPQLISFDHIATRAIRISGTGSGVAGNPNIYRILFMACI
jgi:hypothetical protein